MASNTRKPRTRLEVHPRSIRAILVEEFRRIDSSPNLCLSFMQYQRRTVLQNRFFRHWSSTDKREDTYENSHRYVFLFDLLQKYQCSQSPVVVEFDSTAPVSQFSAHFCMFGFWMIHCRGSNRDIVPASWLWNSRRLDAPHRQWECKDEKSIPMVESSESTGGQKKYQWEWDLEQFYLEQHWVSWIERCNFPVWKESHEPSWKCYVSRHYWIQAWRALRCSPGW